MTGRRELDDAVALVPLTPFASVEEEEEDDEDDDEEDDSDEEDFVPDEGTSSTKGTDVAKWIGSPVVKIHSASLTTGNATLEAR